MFSQVREDQPNGNCQQASSSTSRLFTNDCKATDWFSVNFPMDPQHREVDSGPKDQVTATGSEKTGVTPQMQPTPPPSSSVAIGMESAETG